MGSQSWLDSSGAWAPERRNANHVHDPSPHLPGHMLMALATAAKMADFVNQPAHKVIWGGSPNDPKIQEWWEGTDLSSCAARWGLTCAHNRGDWRPLEDSNPEPAD